MAAKKKAPAITEPLSKAQLVNELVATTDLPKKDIQLVLEELTSIIERHLRPPRKKPKADDPPRTFTMPGLFKITTKFKPAVKAEKNWFNPITKQNQDRAAKPASVQVKVRPLKKLKEFADPTT